MTNAMFAAMTAALLSMPGAPPAAPVPGTAMPTVEVAGAQGESDMDDPAVWIHPDPREAGRSLIVATAKRGGLRVYDLGGRTVQSIVPARD